MTYDLWGGPWRPQRDARWPAWRVITFVTATCGASWLYVALAVAALLSVA